MKTALFSTLFSHHFNNVSGILLDFIEQSNFFSDTDECAKPSSNNCDSNAVCTNTVGTFNCACKSGFTGDGIKCTGMI